MSEVVPFPAPRSNGAREALIEIGQDCPFHIRQDIAGYWADDILLRLGARGFKVVPIEEKDLSWP